MPRHSTAQHSTAQHSTAQHSTAVSLNNQKGVGGLFYYNGINPFRGDNSSRNGFMFLFAIARKTIFILLLQTSLYGQSRGVFLKNEFLQVDKKISKEKILSEKIFNLKKVSFLEEISAKKITVRDEKLHYIVTPNVSVLGFADYQSFDKLFEFYKKEWCIGVGFSFSPHRKSKGEKKK